LTHAVAIWVHLESILCQTELSCHLQFLTSGHYHARGERQSVHMSKITKITGLIRSGTECFIAVYTYMATMGVKGLIFTA